MNQKINFLFRDFNIIVACKKLYKQYGEEYGYSDKIQFNKMSMNELRSFVTIFTQLDYENSTARQTYKVLTNGKDFVCDYNKKKQIQKKLNREFSRRYSKDFVLLYNFVDSEIIRDEKWLGDIRYTIWSYNLEKSSSEFKSFILAYRIYQYCKREMINVVKFIELYNMANEFSSRYLYNEEDDENDENTKNKKIMFAHQMIENPNAELPSLMFKSENLSTDNKKRG